MIRKQKKGVAKDMSLCSNLLESIYLLMLPDMELEEKSGQGNEFELKTIRKYLPTNFFVRMFSAKLAFYYFLMSQTALLKKSCLPNHLQKALIWTAKQSYALSTDWKANKPPSLLFYHVLIHIRALKQIATISLSKIL